MPHGFKLPKVLTEYRLTFSGRAGDLDEIHNALAAGAPVDGRGNNATTALMMASANGHVAALKVLLTAGADTNAVNANGQSIKDYELKWRQNLGLGDVLCYRIPVRCRESQPKHVSIL